MKPIILTFVHYYLPGYKSGGPVRTIANMVSRLGDEFDFRIVTSDRDALDDTPYPSVNVNDWNSIGKAQVFYVSPRKMTLRNIAKLINDTPHDAIYLNSFFTFSFTFLPLCTRRLGFIAKCPVVLAPRGELSSGALQIKSWKKAPFRALSKVVGLYNNLIWQASSEHEVIDIGCNLGTIAQRVVIASVLSPLVDIATLKNSQRQRQPKEPLRLLFLSRISPMKNLDFALCVLQRVKENVHFNIYGPIGDEAYWCKCQLLIAELPRNVSVTYNGSVANTDVPAVMASHDLFFLPTRGENFGHVIWEAFSAGTPVLIADTTPWRQLNANGVGWDLPLEESGDRR